MAAYCTNCAATLDPGVKFCASCGTPTEATPPSRAAAVPATVHEPSTAVSAGNRYPALRIVAILLKVTAAVWVIIGVVGLIAAMSAGSDLPSGLGGMSGFYGFLVLLSCLYFAVMSWAGAELLQVFMDIEDNTRRAMVK